jgi:HEPN domain-containing protein
MANRAKDWLRQAESDLAWAQDSMQGRHWAQVCFTCQQIGEKALKAIALWRGASEVRSHSLARIAEALAIDGDLTVKAKRLDQYYIAARYPDAYAEGSPYEYFVGEQAEEALSFARDFIERAKAELG